MLTRSETIRRRAPIVVVQVRNVPTRWNGWEVYTGNRCIGSYTYKRHALQHAAQIMAARGSR